MSVELQTRTIAGKYRLSRLIGRGGMGSVWEAVHVSLGTTFAIKLIDGQGEIDEETQLRFLNEARAAARLQSRHVVRVFDHGVAETGEPYIAMELLHGEPLSKRLARVGKLSMQDTARIIAQTARALSQAHDFGIVHRDLKPENIFLTREVDVDEEFVKVVDFGIAKLPKTASELAPDTRTGEIMGTPYYMSPEQARGAKTADHRADLWSLGVIAYRCLVGALPFEGNTLVDLMIRITTSPIPVPSELAPTLPRAFDGWFRKAVARDPEDRFSTAMDLAGELARIAGIPFNQEASLRSRLSSIDEDLRSAVPQPGASATSPKVYSSTLGFRTAREFHRTPWIIAAIALATAVGGVGTYAAVRGSARLVDTPPATQDSARAEPTQEPSAPTESARAEPSASASASAAMPKTRPAPTPIRPPPNPLPARTAPAPSPTPHPTPTAPPAATDVGY